MVRSLSLPAKWPLPPPPLPPTVPSDACRPCRIPSALQAGGGESGLTDSLLETPTYV